MEVSPVGAADCAGQVNPSARERLSRHWPGLFGLRRWKMSVSSSEAPEEHPDVAGDDALIAKGVVVLPFQHPKPSIVPVSNPFPLNPANAEEMACAVDGTTMYCYGGWVYSITDGISFFSTMDLNTYTWNTPVGYDAPSTIGMLHSHSLVVIGDSIYIFGAQPASPVNTLWQTSIDSLTSSTSTSSTDGPSARMNHCGANLGTDKMLIYGGEDINRGCLQDTFIFTANTASWVNHTSGAHPPACSHMACASFAGIVYLFGGISPNGAALNELWFFDPDLLAWQPVLVSGVVGSAIPPSPRSSPSLATIGDKYLIISGGTGNDSAFYFFDTIACSWLTSPPTDLSKYVATTTVLPTSSGTTSLPAPSSGPSTQPASSPTPASPPIASSASATPPSPSSPPTAAIAGGAAGGAVLLLIGAVYIAKTRGSRNDARSNRSSSPSSEEAHEGADGADIELTPPASYPLPPPPLGTPSAPAYILPPPPPGAASSSAEHPAPYAPGTDYIGDAPPSLAGSSRHFETMIRHRPTMGRLRRLRRR
ncbi:hypothetical protein BDK51DRAFT_50255 [Blyttiomyces helicus]|uniref:Galactose oxidase n=1 Tax=Blyttiomyces helicus TaxID=388810 RepID=A0A4P9VU85_9FUNG|nr:hypothetical protein BDK51DRAFT_50255 [Blyttiomyces helicus]|eukprot:RKO83139.1 hypothetical protein BDK51DRAFT_50255 [Blyttiomyces helicus]